MKEHHTITIRIPTKFFVYVVVGLVVGLTIGLGLSLIDAAGFEFIAPVCGVPLFNSRPAHATPVSAAPATPVEDIDDHPAALALRTVPDDVRNALDDMVARVLLEKYMRRAA